MRSKSSCELVSSLNSQLSRVSEVSSDSDLDVGVFIGEVQQLLLAEVSLVT